MRKKPKFTRDKALYYTDKKDFFEYIGLFDYSYHAGFEYKGIELKNYLTSKEKRVSKEVFESDFKEVSLSELPERLFDWDFAFKKGRKLIWIEINGFYSHKEALDKAEEHINRVYKGFVYYGTSKTFKYGG